MKKAIYPAFYLLLLIGISACDKNYKPADNTTTATLQVSQPGNLQKGNAVTFSLSSVAASSAVKWTSAPDTGITISASGNSASVLFKSVGTYTVTGTYGTVVGSSTVTVKDTASAGTNTNSSYREVAFASGDQINIVATKMGDTLKNSGFILSGTTTKLYACSSWRTTTVAVGTNSLTINFENVLEPTNASCTGTAPAAVGGGTLPSVSPGTTIQLVINFKGTQYTGTITKSASGTFTITWPYTSGVVISPLTL